MYIQEDQGTLEVTSKVETLVVRRHFSSCQSISMGYMYELDYNIDITIPLSLYSLNLKAQKTILTFSL
jgi:hypothetical protein